MSIKTAVITGGSSGMGLECSKKFLSEGCRVVVIDQNSPDISSENLYFINSDIRNEEEISKALDEILNNDPLNFMVNAAGIYPVSNLETFTKDQYEKIFSVNVLGSLVMARIAAERMPNGGSIVFFSSIDAFGVSKNQLLYSASKAAVVSITKSLAVELSSKNIYVNAIAPGWVRTPGTIAGGRIDDAVLEVPMKRAADCEEIADWVWKFSDGPSYVTGETLCISGGLIVR